MCLFTCANLAASACCACCCAPAKAMGAVPRTYARIGYVIFQLFMIIFTLISMTVFNWIISGTYYVGIACPEASGGGTECVGPSLLVRMSFALAACHLLVFFVCLFRNEAASKFHEGCWCFKILLVIGLMFWSLYWTNDPFFSTYLLFSKYVSLLFLLF